MGGALKNIIALGAGMIDGLDLGDNTKSAFITLGWSELVSLGVSLGAKINTFYGLAGLGDLITTCASPLSRNHHVGYELAKGHSLSEILASMSQVAEGVATTMAVHQLAETLRLKLPLTDLIYHILFKDLPVKEAFAKSRELIKSCYQNSLDILR